MTIQNCRIRKNMSRNYEKKAKTLIPSGNLASVSRGCYQGMAAPADRLPHCYNRQLSRLYNYGSTFMPLHATFYISAVFSIGLYGSHKIYLHYDFCFNYLNFFYYGMAFFSYNRNFVLIQINQWYFLCNYDSWFLSHGCISCHR